MTHTGVMSFLFTMVQKASLSSLSLHPLLLANLQGRGGGRCHRGRRVRHRGHYRCILRTKVVTQHI